jgi:hypothetical protein
MLKNICLALILLSLFWSKAEAQSIWKIYPITDGPYEPVKAWIKFYPATGNASNKLRKTVIVLEKLDKFNENNNIEAFRGRHTIVGELINNGYDVVGVDFQNYVASVGDNALIVEKVLALIQPHKEDADFPVSIVAFGPSGLMAHMALRSLKTNNVAHYVRNVYTIDTPYQGMQASLGLEMMLKRLRSTTGFPETNGAFVSSYKKFETFFNSALYKQLAIFKGDELFDDMKATSFGANSFEAYAYDNTSVNGFLNGFHTNGYDPAVRKIALTNGSSFVGSAEAGGVLLNSKNNSYETVPRAASISVTAQRQNASGQLVQVLETIEPDIIVMKASVD